MNGNFRLIDNFSESDGIAVMRINKRIISSDDEDQISGISGNLFTSEFDYVSNYLKPKKIKVLINSSGGSLFDGLEIYQAIKDSKIPTETVVVGISASIAGIISQAGHKRVIKDYATFHAHSPRPAEGATVQKILLDQTFDSLKSILVSSTGMEEDRVISILSTETFLNATDALKMGFFDEVETTNMKLSEKVMGKDPNNMMKVFNELGKTKVKIEMSTKVNAVLNLAPEASEASRVEAITELKAKASKVEGLEASISDKDTEIQRLNTELDNSNREKATTLVDNAITEGKITDDKSVKKGWVDNAVRDYAGTKLLIDNMKTVVASVKIDTGGDAPKVENSEDRSKWGYEQWSKKDPQGLGNMKVSDSKKFNELLNAYLEA